MIRNIRQFSHSARCFKNPYIFYDLAGKQPTHTQNKTPKLFKAATTLTFDTSDTANDNLTAEQRAKLVFGEIGSRQARREDAEKLTRTIGGIRVPPRPDEPENCCMSGCINCVWELYKEDIDHWQDRRKQAHESLLKSPGAEWPADFGTPPPTADRPDAKDEWDDVDVSIKVFLDTEKRLRARKQKEREQREAKQAEEGQSSL